jgi:ArsR family metal-binding transcriptional regulator
MSIKKVALIVSAIVLLIPISIFAKASMPHVLNGDSAQEDLSPEADRIASAAERIGMSSYDRNLIKMTDADRLEIAKLCPKSNLPPRKARHAEYECSEKVMKAIVDRRSI